MRRPGGSNCSVEFRSENEDAMILVGLILLVVGFLTGISILWTIGIILLVVGAVLWILGSVGHAVGGRRHYY
ncbi:hypothetical protein Snoj_31740 [Streptomyces nojiriensis]|uniref:DUF4337 domain-containing protein n=2 Tax=Streptomyces nojiriensis TaxID=66374 RepID=A0ABQ3SM98_9ACTN|nr:hypothetical protein Snoj_31740 [Streptomyces nojiriensis]